MEQRKERESWDWERRRGRENDGENVRNRGRGNDGEKEMNTQYVNLLTGSF